VAGLRISTSEVLDCLDQLKLVDILDEKQFAAVLRANFAKSRREQFHFDRLYDLFFHELRQEPGISHGDPLSEQIQNTLLTLAAEQNGNKTHQAVLDFLNGDPLPFLEQMQQDFMEGNGQGGGMGSNLGPMIQRLGLMLQINAVDDMLMQYITDQRDRMQWETRRDLKELFDARLASARGLLTRQGQPFEDDSTKTPSYQQNLDRLGDIHFASLTKKEVAGMRDAIDQLVRKLKDTVNRRYALSGYSAGTFFSKPSAAQGQNCYLVRCFRFGLVGCQIYVEHALFAAGLFYPGPQFCLCCRFG
jgi:uncharacterized protein with von Willebrand factor type A (vWA) domain